MCTLESESKDEELKTECTLALATLSQTLLQPEVIPTVLHTLKTVSTLLHINTLKTVSTLLHINTLKTVSTLLHVNIT